MINLSTLNCCSGETVSWDGSPEDIAQRSWEYQSNLTWNLLSRFITFKWSQTFKRTGNLATSQLKLWLLQLLEWFKLPKLPTIYVVFRQLFMTLALAAFGTVIYVKDGTWNKALGIVNGTGPLVSGPFLSGSLRTAASTLETSDDYLRDWIPLLCVLIFTVAFSIGVGPIAWLLISELYPLEFRGIGGAITTSFSYACAFVSVKTFVDFQTLLGLHGAFWLYAVISLFGLGFVLVFVPETRGRGLDEMETKSVTSLPPWISKFFTLILWINTKSNNNEPKICFSLKTCPFRHKNTATLNPSRKIRNSASVANS